MDVLDSLSTSQREILASFQAITNQDNIETSVEVLNGTSWDLEAAISNIYNRPAGSNPVTSNAYPPTTEGFSSSRPLLDQFGIDDSIPLSRSLHSRSAAQQTQGDLSTWLGRISALPLSILAWPAGVLYGAAGLVLSFIARILHVRPRVSGLRPRNPFARDPNARASQRVRLDPKNCAERWIRSVEELTGSVRWSKRDMPNDLHQGGKIKEQSVESEASGSSTMGLRRIRGHEKTIPDFFEGSYEDAVRTAKQTQRLLLVVLTSEEHEDDENFKKSVLADLDLGRVLRIEDILCWGGDVRDRDAYLASKTLRPFRYPSITFVALQPPPASTSRNATAATMAVISRLEGSPQASTSAAAVIAHLNNVVLPRVAPYLTRLKSQAAARAAERQLREEQDRAYARAVAQDTERVLARRKLEDERRMNAITSARQSEEARRETEQKVLLRQKAAEWRARKRIELEKAGVPDEKEAHVARVVVTLGDGRRIVRRFRGSDTVEMIYAFVECSLDLHEDEALDGQLKSVIQLDDYSHIYEFRLATTFPRQVLEVDGAGGERTVAEVGCLTPSGNLVAEGLEKRKKSLGLESSGDAVSEDEDEDDDDDKEEEKEEEEED